MKRFYLLLSILFIATSFTFAQTNKNTAQANKKKMAQIQKQREQQRKKTAQMQQQKAKEQQKKSQAKPNTAQTQPQNTQAKPEKEEVAQQPAEKPTPKAPAAKPQKKPSTQKAQQQKMAQQKAAQQKASQQKSQMAQNKQPKGKTTKENNTVKDPEVVLPSVAITDENNDTIKVRQRNWFDSFKKDRKLPPIEEKGKELKLYYDPINNFEFNFVSCIGDPETGKVEFTFTYTYASRSVQEINMPTGAKAKDIDGELYLATHCQGGQKRNTISKKPDAVVLCMNYVPSSLKEFISIATSFNTSKSGNTVIEFTNIPIVWEKKTE